LKSNNLKILDEKDTESARWFAIISQLKPYALIWAINKHTSFQFKPGDFFYNETIFPKYCYHNSATHIDFTIFVNKMESGVLLKDLKNTDYLLKIRECRDDIELSNFLSKLKRINEINGVTPVAFDRLKKDKKTFLQLNI